MTVWDFIDRHPWLSALFALLIAECIPSFRFHWRSGGKDAPR